MKSFWSIALGTRVCNHYYEQPSEAVTFSHGSFFTLFLRTGSDLPPVSLTVNAIS
jgi:hypothetical protein